MRRDGSNRLTPCDFDARTIVLLALCVCVTSYLAPTMLAHAVLACAVFLLAVLLGQGAMGAKMLGGYAITVGWLLVDLRFGIMVPPPMVFALVYKTIPVLMAVLLLSAVPSAKLTDAIRRLPVPNNLQVILSVMLRFAPTVADELRAVRDAMRTRGFISSPTAVLAHPFRTLEYAVVPLVLRELTLADELAATAVVRGIESPLPKHGYYINRIGPPDVLLIVASVTMSAVLIAAPGLLRG